MSTWDTDTPSDPPTSGWGTEPCPKCGALPDGGPEGASWGDAMRTTGRHCWSCGASA